MIYAISGIRTWDIETCFSIDNENRSFFQKLRKCKSYNCTYTKTLDVFLFKLLVAT